MFNIWPSTIYQQPMTGSLQQPVLPASLAKHPVQWTKHEIAVWLKWCSEEYSIEPIPPDRIDMNGKALCLLKRSDFMERIPKNGDLLFNALQKLIQSKVNHNIPMTSVCSIGGQVPMSPFHIKTEPLSPMMHLLTSSNTHTTSMHAPSLPRHCVPILPRPVTSVLPPTGSSSVIHSSKPYCNTVSTVPGILSPAPSNVDTESASSDNGSVSDPEVPDNEDHSADTTTDRLLPTTIKTDIHSIPSAFQAVNTGLKPEAGTECRLLWEFIHQLLQNPVYSQLVCWENEKDFVFRINNPTGLAHMWGQQKNRTNMTYEKLSRALRYYYRMNIIKKVSGKRLTYKFMQQPSTIQKGQRGAKPHNRCDLPVFPPNRVMYPGMKEEITDETSRNAPESPSVKNGRHIHQSHSNRQGDADKLKNSEITSTSKFSPSNHELNSYDISSYDQGQLSGSTGHILRHPLSRFHTSTSFDKKPHRLTPLLLGTNYQNEPEFSPEVKLNLNSFSHHSPVNFEHLDRHSKSLKRHFTPTPTNFFGGQFEGDPQNEPEDLSVTSSKKRRESSEEGHSPDDGNQTPVSSDEGNKILPLLINYKKSTPSSDS